MEAGRYKRGAIRELSSGSSTIVPLAWLDGSGNGAGPIPPLLFHSGILYGTAFAGGAQNRGTVYAVDIAAKTLTVFATFSGINGANPCGGLTMDGYGNLSGLTYAGGGGDRGIRDRLSPIP